MLQPTPNCRSCTRWHIERCSTTGGDTCAIANVMTGFKWSCAAKRRRQCRISEDVAKALAALRPRDREVLTLTAVGVLTISPKKREMPMTKNGARGGREEVHLPDEVANQGRWAKP